MPRATKIGRVVTCHEVVPPLKSHDPLIVWSCKITDDLKPLYLHYHIAYGYQTWQGGSMQWGALTHKFTLSFNHVVLWGHLKKSDIVYFHLCKSSGHQTWEGGDLP